jgi:hypothetical protein
MGDCSGQQQLGLNSGHCCDFLATRSFNIDWTLCMHAFHFGAPMEW